MPQACNLKGRVQAVKRSVNERRFSLPDAFHQILQFLTYPTNLTMGIHSNTSLLARNLAF